MIKINRVKFALNNLKNSLRGGKDDKPGLYPLKIELPTYRRKLQFEAFSPVEKYRLANYGGEKFFVEEFTKLIEIDDIVLDIGASVGLMAVHAAIFAENGKVFAFEPDPETMERLQNNVELNNLSNVTFVPWAVSDREGEATLFTDGASGFAPTLKEQLNRPGAPKGKVTVQTRTLDNEISIGNLPLPTVLKIDIEGAEVLCLHGAESLLNGSLGKKPRLIFLELHPEFLPSFGASAARQKYLSSC
ncbi:MULTISPECIES: FkbM family methyltransferase [unclassified Moorena]|uniref:FkbM family methyltransferase n=1 Tax=unclassified Moorena TaxID=2683338 RepID=UPI0013FF5672|nr:MULTISPECIES: FkbM family methyltransferase [unclassified Moorena]NEO13850.1 FkbM family methyltransferase [Moorena sp. SIO3E8]NEQ00300.1 FkbM family methyltransferase [Moorena sp. SIO3F7]